MMNPSMQERLAQRHQRREERRKRELGDNSSNGQDIYFNASFGGTTTKSPIGKSNSTGNLLTQQMEDNNNLDAGSNRGRARDGGIDSTLRGSYTNGVPTNPASLLSLRPPPKDTRSYNYGAPPPNRDSRRYSTNNLQDPLAIPSNTQGARGRESKRGGVQRTRSRSLTDLRRGRDQPGWDPKAPTKTPNGGTRKKIAVRRGSTRANFVSSSPLTTSTANSTPSASPADEDANPPPTPRMVSPKPSALKRRVSSAGTVGSGKKRISSSSSNPKGPSSSSSRAVKGAKGLDNSEPNLRSSRRSSAHRGSTSSAVHDGSMSEMSLSSRRNSSGKSLRKGSVRDGSEGGARPQRRRPSHKRLSGEDRDAGGKPQKERKPKSGAKKKMSLSQSLQSMTLLQTPNENDDDDDETVLFTAIPTPGRSVCGDSLAGHSLAGHRRHTSPAPRAVAPSPSQSTVATSGAASAVTANTTGNDTANTNANQSWSMANPDQVNKWKSKLASSSTHTTNTNISVSENNHHSKPSSLKLGKTTNNSRSTHASPKRQQRRNSFGGMSRGTSWDGSKSSDDWNTTLSHHTISNHELDGDDEGEDYDDDDDSDSEYSMYDDDNDSVEAEPSPQKRSLNDSVPTLMDVSDMATDAEEDISVLNISRGSLPSLVTDTDTSFIQTPPRSKADERILRSSQKQSLLGPSNTGGLQILNDNARNHNPTDDLSQRNENSRSHESTVRSKSMSSSGRRSSTRTKESSHGKTKDNNSGHGKSTNKEKESRTRSRSLTAKPNDAPEGSPPQPRRKSHSKSTSRRSTKNGMDDSGKNRKGGLRRASVYDSDDNEEAPKPKKKSQQRSSSKSSSRRLKDESNGENRGRSSKKKGERSSSKSKPRQASKSPKAEPSRPRRGVNRNRSRSLSDMRVTKPTREPKQRSSSTKMMDASCPENISSGTRRSKRTQKEKSRPRRSKTQDNIKDAGLQRSQTEHQQKRRSRASTVDGPSETKRSVSRNRSSSLTDLRRGDRPSPFEEQALADANNTIGTAIFEIEIEAQDIELLKAQIQKMEAELTTINNLPKVGSATESPTTDGSGSTRNRAAIDDDSSKLPLAKPDAIINYLKGEKQREEKEQKHIKEKIFDMMQENTKAKERLDKTQQYFSELEDIHNAEVMKNEALLKNVPVFQKVIEAHEIKLARRGRYIEFERQTTQFYEDRMRSIVRNFQANCDDFELVRTLEQMAGMDLTDKGGSASCAAQSSRAQGGNRMSFRT